MRRMPAVPLPHSSVTSLSIILPVFDRRTAGWRSLESALAQDFARGDYEIVVVLGHDAPAHERDAVAGPLIARCDTVVRTALDIDDVASEVALYAAGAQAARGDLLFFMEGHTELRRDCCAAIASHFRRRPGDELAWAPRVNCGETALGRLVSLHNLRHEARAASQDTFSLGANSVIRRNAYARLGGLDPRFGRLAETVLLRRAQGEGLPIGRIEAPLATHHNDMGLVLWHALIMQMGASKCAWYGALRDDGADLRGAIRHRAYLAADSRWRARMLYPVLAAMGYAALAAAMATLRLNEALASRLYWLALGFTDLAGYCQISRQRAPASPSRPPPARPHPAPPRSSPR